MTLEVNQFNKVQELELHRAANDIWHFQNRVQINTHDKIILLRQAIQNTVTVLSPAEHIQPGNNLHFVRYHRSSTKTLNSNFQTFSKPI